MTCRVDAPPSSEGAPPARLAACAGPRQSLSELTAEILALRSMPATQAELAAQDIASRVLNAEGIAWDAMRILGSGW